MSYLCIAYFVVNNSNVSFSRIITLVGREKERALFFLLLITRIYVVSVRRVYLFLLVLMVGLISACSADPY